MFYARKSKTKNKIETLRIPMVKHFQFYSTDTMVKQWISQTLKFYRNLSADK